MSPSVYLGCTIQETTFDALSEVNAVFQEIEKDSAAVLAQLDLDMQQLTGDKIKASVTVGSTAQNEVVWTAVDAGVEGNQISIAYVYQTPTYDFVGGAFLAMPPTSTVTGTTITLYPAVDANGEIDALYTTADNLLVWMSNTDITKQVTSSLVSLGTDLPVLVPRTFLTGGKGAPLKDAEEAADLIAKQFGVTTYQELMRSVDIPVIESDAEAAAYLESLDDAYVIVNKKLLLVEGTNLVGIRGLYNLLGKNVTSLRKYLTLVKNQPQVPHLFLTENAASTRYEYICGVLTAVSTFTEELRGYDQSLPVVAEKYTNNDISLLNGYIFWILEAQPTAANYRKLSFWGYLDELLNDILSGDTPVVTDLEYIGLAQIPLVYTIDDPTILDVYLFTDAEVVELLDKENVPGIRAPSTTDSADKSDAVKKLLKNNREALPNGMRTKVKRPIVASQALDLSKTGGDVDLSKELATRGKACARQKDNMRSTKDITTAWKSPNVPNLDLPNMPTPDLPDVAKQVEAAFGALSSVVSSASKLFDRLVGGLIKIVKGVLNKLQNILSMADNLLNNSLAQCLLGTSTDATGVPSPPALGSGTTGGSVGSISIGGIPIPMALLGDALKALSDVLDATMTTAFETMMKLIAKPVCMIQSLLNDILGIDLGGLTNPCKNGKDPNKDCPPEATQEIINESASMTSVMEKLPQTALYPTTSAVVTVNEKVQDFTGVAVKTVTSVAQEITRGVQEVMTDITKSLDSKMETISEFDKAIKELLGETKEMANSNKESQEKEEGCAPSAIGALSDAISAFI